MILQNGTIIEENKIFSRTYKLNLEKNCIQGFTDGIQAMEQAIYKILNTERYEHIIYSFNYGIEFGDLLGKDATFIRADLKRRIEEALFQDERIVSIENFEMNEGEEKDSILVSFEVVTTEGNVNVRQEVRI